MRVPRYYQEDACNAIFKYFEDGKEGNPVAALPTGTGKSLVIALFIKRAFALYGKNQRFLVVTHVKELVQGNFETLLDVWPTAPAGIYSAGLGRKDVGQKITFCGIASVAKKPEAFGKVDIVIVDECHLVGQKETTNYLRFFTQLWEANNNIRIIGLSATPYRMGQGLITDGGLFTDICFDITGKDAFLQLIAEGYLAKLVAKQTAEVLDVSRVGLSNTGDFNMAELADAVDHNDVTERAVREILAKSADRKKGLIFASSLAHAEHIGEMLARYKETACVVHSKMSEDLRDHHILEFKKKVDSKFRFLVNCNVFTTGHDCPQIDLIAMLRPTLSTSLWVQMLGRGTRPCEGKADCLVLDFAGNTRRLGPVNEPLLPRKKGSRKGGLAPVKACPVCMVYVHARATVCPECGAPFVGEGPALTEVASSDELVAGGVPIVETFEVDNMSFKRHRSRTGKPDSIVVSYGCGLRMFSDWLFFSHPGYASKRSRDLWRSLTTEPHLSAPTSTDEAIVRFDEMGVPGKINVWVNRREPRVMHVFPKVAPGAAVGHDLPF